YLSLYVDEKLRKGLKSESDENVEKLLDKALVLFRFLQEKDVFEKYYKQHMARRLLLDKSISDDMERMMITKLKTECGCHFTLKLENMFRDKELWTTQATAFKEYKENFLRGENMIDISVRVLTAGIWPTQSATVCILPPVCEYAFNMALVVFQMFSNFYVNKHNGRKLTLNTMLGTADVKAVFYGGGTAASEIDWDISHVQIVREVVNLALSRSASVESPKPGTSDAREPRKEENKILMVNTHQMIILMCFNNQPRITFEALLEQTNIAEKELKRNLQSLAMGKHTQRILCRKGKGKDIGECFYCYILAFLDTLSSLGSK
ncbi:unnamed protein product, partial [Strongylus vulgaris]